SSSNGSDLQQAHKSHPDAYHTSRILDEEIAKSKSLKSYTSNDSSLNNLDFNSFL
ncbi:22604_t:CDS:1, partial [Entrophospora sp. SA101]